MSHEPSERCETSTQWRTPSGVAQLSEDETHLWRIELDAAHGDVERAMAALSGDERTRALRYRSSVHQVRFARTRGAVRAILSRYLSCAPSDLRFCYGERGKPSIEGVSEIEFNVSHSGGLALCAVTRGRLVGVDVEAVRTDRPLLRLSERFFTIGETAVLREFAPEEQAQAFFQCWTLKEAYIKARGEGLAIPLNQFEVTWRNESPEVELRVVGDPSESKRWSLRRTPVDRGYAAALAVEGHGLREIRWRYSDSG